MSGDQAVSYVLTVYNKAPYLPGVLEAVAREHAATGGEIILVDDGSTDSSSQLIATFAAGRPEAIVIAQANRGVAAATNVGIARACQPYLRLVDADDVLRKGSTRRLIAALEQTGCGFAYGGFTTDAGAVRSDAGEATVVEDPLRAMLVRQPFIPATTLALTAVMKRAIPLPEDIRTSQDFALGLRLAALTQFAALDHTCCISPSQSGGLSSSKGRMFRDTVLLALRLGQEQRWNDRYRCLAMARNAGRARNYLRRHGRNCRGRIICLSALALATHVPFLWSYGRVMGYIAKAYDGFD